MLREVDTVAFHAGHGADTPRDNRTDQQNREYALHRFLLSHVLFLSRMSASSWPRCWHVSDRKRSHGNLDSSTWRRCPTVNVFPLLPLRLRQSCILGAYMSPRP